MRLKFMMVLSGMALVMFNAHNADAQGNAANKIPPFRILLTSGKYLQADELDNSVKKLIIYFDPTCDHCKVFTEDLLRNIYALGNTRIIMITYTPLNQVKQFESQFKLTNYPTISIGTEGTSYTVQRFYSIQKFPYVAVYDQKNMLVAAFREVPAVQTVLMKLK